MSDKKENSFFNKLIISIKNFEKYPELAIKNWKEVLSYIIKLLLIFTAISSIAYSYVIPKQIKEISDEEFNSITTATNMNLFTKQELLEYFEDTNQILLYVKIYAIIFVYLLIFNIISVFFEVILLTIFGYIATIFMRLRIRFNALFKIAIHSLTLPIILKTIVILVENFTAFRVKYFEFMYIGIACVYIITAISMLRMDIIKNKEELMNILEEQKRDKEELERQEREKKEEEKRKLKEKEEKDNKEEENKNEEEDNSKDNNEAQEEGT